MEERGVKVKIGVFVVAGISLFVLFFYLLGTFRFSGGRELRLHFRANPGLNTGAAVMVLGLKAGYVKNIKLLGADTPVVDGHHLPVRVIITVDDEYFKLFTGATRFSVGSAGVLGERYLSIDPGYGGEGTLDTSKTLVGQGGGGIGGMMASAGKLMGRMEEADDAWAEIEAMRGGGEEPTLH